MRVAWDLSHPGTSAQGSCSRSGTGRGPVLLKVRVKEGEGNITVPRICLLGCGGGCENHIPLSSGAEKIAIPSLH